MKEQHSTEGDAHTSKGSADSTLFGESQAEEQQAVNVSKQTNNGKDDADKAPDVLAFEDTLRKILCFLKRPDSQGIIMAAATVVIAIFTALTFYVIWTGSGDTKKAAAAADKFATSADLIRQKIDSVEGDFQRMATASENSIKATEDAMRLDQRAWVSVKGIGGVPQLNQPWDVNVFFINTGKTPAKNTRLSCKVEPRKAEKDVSFKEVPYASTGSLMPPGDIGTFCGLHPIPEGEKITQDALDTLSRHEITIFVFGSVSYEDVFDKPHWMTFCRVMQADGKNWNTCAAYRDDTGDGKYTQPK